MFGASNLRTQSSANWAEETEEPTLIIGDLMRWTKSGRHTKTFDHFHFSSFSELSADTLSYAKPTIVLSPLIADSFDAMDVASLLHELDFGGVYRAITAESINPAIICHDINLVACNLNFDVLVIPDLKDTISL